MFGKTYVRYLVDRNVVNPAVRRQECQLRTNGDHLGSLYVC